jgi:hypothetical protein
LILPSLRHERRERAHRHRRGDVAQAALLVIKAHHADWGISVRIAFETAKQPQRLLGAGEFCENPSVSVINE